MTKMGNGDSAWRRPVLGAILLLTVFLGARHVTEEAAVMLGGDMSRYIMNGVFMRDAIADGGIRNYGDLVAYAERYYARYPALSLGHHPPVPSAALLPFFAVFGVSLSAARLAAVGWFVLAAWGLYAVTRRLSTWQAASWATLLFVTNVIVLRAGQYVLSEMPMTALVLWSVRALMRWCDTRRPWHLTEFVALAAVSLYAKQLAVFMFPVYGVILVSMRGWRVLLDRQILMLTAAGVILVVPIVAISIGFAPANVSLVLSNATRLLHGTRDASVNEILTTIISTHLTLPPLVVTAASALLVWRRNRQAIIGLTWAVCVVGGSVVFAGAFEPARYAFGALPAYFLMTATLVSEARTVAARRAVAVLLTAVAVWQVYQIRYVYPSGAGGYEAAAEYVLAQGPSPGILFASSVDTGYFVFFVRKHDSAGRHFVLRADQLPTALSGASAEAGALAVRSTLRRYGVRFVVAEEGPFIEPGLRRLYDELKSGRFIERRRIPVVSTAVRDTTLAIYEFKDAQPPDLDAELYIDLPRGNRNIKLRVRDLVGEGGR